MDDGTDHDDEVRTAIADLEQLLVADGPQSVEDLAEALTARHPASAAALAVGPRGADLAGRVLDVARQSEAFWRLPDGRLAPVLHHLRRATFTHRLDAGELERDAVDLCPDLIALALPRTFTLADGTEIRTVGSTEDRRAADEGSLVGPTGWLRSFAPGDLVAVCYDGSSVAFEPVAAGSLDADAAARTTAALASTAAELPSSPAAEVHRLLVDTIGLHPDAFATAVAPVADLLAGAGLRVREVWVGPAAAGWATPAEQARQRRLDELLTGADPCCRQAGRRALDRWQHWMEAGGATVGDAATAAVEDVDHGPVAGVLAELATLGRPLLALRRLGRWADALATASASTTAGVAYLQALGADASGDPLTAVARLEAGLAVEPDHPACLGFLAELAQDRGDAQEAAALLQRTGRPAPPDVTAELAPFLVARSAGRNDPCPCGSGRKFKACCAVRPTRRPLVQRCRWLLAKATRHAIRTDPLALRSLQQLFDTGYGGGDARALAGDLLLFANGGLARYVDNRGALLPDDELACARAWLEQPMRVLRIGVADAAGLLATRDERDGTPLTVDDANAAATLAEGETVLTRALPVEDVHLLTTAVLRVPEASRQRALDLVAEEVRPMSLLHFLVDLQVDQLKAAAPFPPGHGGAAGGLSGLAGMPGMPGMPGPAGLAGMPGLAEPPRPPRRRTPSLPGLPPRPATGDQA